MYLRWIVSLAWLALTLLVNTWTAVLKIYTQHSGHGGATGEGALLPEILLHEFSAFGHHKLARAGKLS